MDLSADDQKLYTVIIDDILSHSDLTQVSEKKIRKAMQERLPERDIQSQKAAIGVLVLERFELANSAQIFEAEEPLKKKIKSQAADADARLAARLQREENASRARPSRSGVTKKTITKRRSPKKKSAAKIKGEDDSEVELGSDGEPKVKIKMGGFHKPYALSHELAELVGKAQAARTECVKEIWKHIKANNLQDPSDKRQILCDATMQAVFKVERVHMFTMNKLLGKHLFPIEEVAVPGATKVEVKEEPFTSNGVIDRRRSSP